MTSSRQLISPMQSNSKGEEMKNEYRQYLIKLGGFFTLFSLLTLLSQEWLFLWFLVNTSALALFLVLRVIVEKPFTIFDIFVMLPLLLFFVTLALAFFDVIDDSFVKQSLLLTILTPIFILIGGLLQPRET